MIRHDGKFVSVLILIGIVDGILAFIPSVPATSVPEKALLWCFPCALENVYSDRVMVLRIFKEVSNMAGTIFSVLRGLERGQFKPDVSVVLESLVSFIESGVCSGSKVDKFIMQNFRLSATKLTELWNKRYSQSKSASTFRGQISLLSGYIFSILGCTAQELNDAFAVGDMEMLRSISDIIGVFSYGSMDLADAFIGQELLPSGSLDSKYNIADCQQELCLLRSLNKKDIQSMVGSVDSGKLSYLLGVLSQPLVTDVYVKYEGKKKKVKTARVNRDKVQFLKALSSQTSHLPMPAAKVSENHLSCSNNSVSAQTLDAVPPVPYRLGLSGQLMALLQSEMKKYEALPEDMKRATIADSNEKSRQNAERLLRLVSADGFRAYVNKLNAYDLYIALQKYKL